MTNTILSHLFDLASWTVLLVGGTALAGVVAQDLPPSALAGPTATPIHADDGLPERYARELPRFALRDPFGERHQSERVAEHGLIVVVTAPTFKNRKAQVGWAEHLLKTRPEGNEALVFLQDMSASWFDERAREEMREEDDPDEPPLLLLDEEGELRKRMGAKKGETVVLVYGADHQLRRVEREDPSRARAEQLWDALEAGDVQADAR